MATQQPDFEEVLFSQEQNEPAESIQIMKVVATALRRKYILDGNHIAIKFIEYVRENGFGEDTEGFVDELQQDVDESSFVEHLADEFPVTFSSELQKQDLQSILSNRSVQRNAGHYLSEKSFKWTLTRKQSEDAREFLNKHCEGMIPPSNEHGDMNTDLVDIVAIGDKNSMYNVTYLCIHFHAEYSYTSTCTLCDDTMMPEIPLLTWLSDTYSRYNINRHYQGQRPIRVEDWRTHYKLLHKLKALELGKSQQSISTKVGQALISFHKRVFQPIDFTKMVLLDDDINDYVQYFIAMQKAVRTLKAVIPVKVQQFCPFHVDLWIIPRKVIDATATDRHSDHNDSDDDDVDDDEKGGGGAVPDGDGDGTSNWENIQNIGDKLEEQKWTHFSVPHPLARKELDVGIGDLLANRLVEGIQKVLLKDCGGVNGQNGQCRNQRVIVIVDRRKCGDPDLIYAAQHKEERFRQIPGRSLPETSFWMTKNGLFPGDPDGQHQGTKFVLSWHVEAADVVRTYWQFGHWTTRFLPMDTVHLWPQWFRSLSGCDCSPRSSPFFVDVFQHQKCKMCN